MTPSFLDILIQLAFEVRAELTNADPADSKAATRAIAKADLLRRLEELLSTAETETIDTGDSEHSIIEPVPTETTKPENTEPI